MNNLIENIGQNMLGKWESLAVEARPNPWGGQYFLKRYFENTAQQAHATLVFYTDETAQDLNITIEVIGPFTFLQPSTVVSGAVDTDFEFTRIAVTPHSQGMVDMLNGDPKPYLNTWEADVRQEVNVNGQSVMGMTIGQYKEYDLLKVEDDKLYYGERPADGSAPDELSKRATSLQVPLKKVEKFSI